MDLLGTGVRSEFLSTTFLKTKAVIPNNYVNNMADHVRPPSTTRTATTMPPKTTASTHSSKSKRKIKYKTTQKKEITPAAKLKRLFKSLCAQIDGGHFKNAVKTCDKSTGFSLVFQLSSVILNVTCVVLRIDPKDADALQAKLFLLLQSEQYSTALTLLEGLDSSTPHLYEKAYTLYRLQRESEAGEVLPHLKLEEAVSDVHGRGVAHLEAQIVSVALAMNTINH